MEAGRLADSNIRQVLSRARTEKDALSPWVYKKIDLQHLEIEGTDSMVLKFRKSKFTDGQELSAEFGADNILEAFDKLEPVKMIEILSRFLSRETAKELMKIKFLAIGNDGKEVEKAYTLSQRLCAVWMADTAGLMELLDTLLSIQGLTKEQIDAIFELDEQKQKDAASGGKKGKDKEKKKKGTPTPK